jgi:hypothetical protein
VTSSVNSLIRRRATADEVAPPSLRYEFWRGEDVVSTGRFTRERALKVGERIQIGGELGVVRAVEPLLLRLEVESDPADWELARELAQKPFFANASSHALRLRGIVGG